MPRLSRLVGVATVLLILAGCSAAAPSSIAGTWSGTMTDVLAGPGTLQFSITQSESSLTGTWTMKFPAAANPVGGTLTGTLSGSNVTLVLTNSNPAACAANVTATVSGSTMTGMYSECTGDGGTFTAQLQ
jgi:hypothetical protein